MILEIILLISSVTRASILDHLYLSDGSKYYPINDCTYYGFYCNPLHIIPCCDKNDVCKVLKRHGNQENVFTCTKPTMAGDYCHSTADCLTLHNSKCELNKCECLPNYVSSESKKQCVPSVIGKSCRSDINCKDLLHTKCSDEKKCTCRDDNHILVNNATCLPLLREFCWSNERCWPEHSVCINNVCQCKQGYRSVSNNMCVE
ncbi:uncharacterized protein LOC130664841 [Microplitis mediator]|uniref:uncharacterized protein LOC130664841 n=1 Tax=Microplitis mediator TaxID=375433 RepID=UPI002554FC2E|nr:uncharacterized protein LOC130664841 [Microplitis mediator]